MKKMICLLLAALLPLAACGCVEDASGSGAVPSQDSAQPGPGGSAGTASGYALAAPQIPVQAPYPNESAFFGSGGTFDSEGFDAVYEAWSADVKARREAAQAYPGKLNAYLKRVTAEFLKTEGSGNAVCSPLNIWMALAMAAETADGATRDELLDLLGMSSIQECRSVAAALWRANYCDDGACTSKMAASLWLNKDFTPKADCLKTLAEQYYASGFQGDMADPAYSAAFKDWLNENTGGLLQDAVNGLEDFKPGDLMTLATTVYFCGAWADKFAEGNTYSEVFHSPAGDQETDFMHRSGAMSYYWSDHFAAVPLSFEDAGSMWLLLPDEGVTPSDLLESGEALEFLLESWEKRSANSKHLIVDMAVPKFDVEADMDLQKRLTALGAGGMFSREADFRSLTDMEGVYISSATHDARVKIDEEGCEAAAFTVMMYAGAAMPPDERVEFKLDRPFLFALTGEDGLPLFYGVVNSL